MTTMRLTNEGDLEVAARGLMPAEAVRTLVSEGLVDTGAVTLALPEELVEALGLRVTGQAMVRLADGSPRLLSVVGGLRIEILGRTASLDAFVLPEGSTPLIGQIPLERLDLLVDPRSRQAIVNPASPDFPVLDLLRVA